MSQKLYPSAHILEMFMPYLHDEKRLIGVLKEIVGRDFYRNVELPSFPTKEHRETVRSILKDNDLTAITFVAPFLNEQKMSLCDLDDRRREEVLDFLKMHADFAAESGYTTFGVPSGPYPGDEKHDEAMAAQADTLARIADYTAALGMNCSIEPLDRYAHKKALIGPMDEVVEWFRPLHEAHPNLFLHWDSAHERLGGLGIFNTLEMAAPFLSQIHLCDCIDDPTHPCFGDLHMDGAWPQGRQAVAQGADCERVPDTMLGTLRRGNEPLSRNGETRCIILSDWITAEQRPRPRSLTEAEKKSARRSSRRLPLPRNPAL